MWNTYFTYDASSGQLTWKERQRNEFKSEGSWKRWNNRFSGTIAGWKKMNRGASHSIEVRLNEKPRPAHRIIWEMCNGPIPKGMQIDHIDADPWNNRLSNLRLCTRSQNMMNRGRPIHNKSGYKGVSWNPKMGRWRAQIKANGKSVHLGWFSDPSNAHAAYVAAAADHHGSFARTQ